MAEKWKPPDGGYGWVIVIASFFLDMLMITCIGCFGVFMPELMNHFGISKTTTAFFNACQTISFSITGLLTGPFIKQYGCRPVVLVIAAIAATGWLLSAFITDYRLLYITFGFMAGTSWGGFYICAGVATQQYFDKRRGLATGIITIGVGVGIFCWPIVSRFLIDQLGWRSAVAIIGGIILNGAPFGALLRPPPLPPSDVTLMQRMRSIIDLSVLKNIHFLIFCMGVFCIQIGHYVPYAFIPLRAAEQGTSKSNAAILVSVLGATNTLGRLLMGWLGDRKWLDRVLLHGGTCMTAGLLTAMSFFLTHYAWLLVYVILCGVFGAGYISLLFPVNVDLLGMERLASATGIQMVVMGIAMSISSPLAGFIADSINTKSSFLLLGSLQALGGLTVCILAIYRRIQKKREVPTTEQEMTSKA